MVYISNLDSRQNEVISKHFVFEERIKMDFSNLSNNISVFTMKDIVKYLKGHFKSSKSILTQFIRKLVKRGTYHILIDELESYNPSVLAEIQAIKLNSCSLTVAVRGNTDLGKLKLNEGSSFVLNKIMSMSKQVYDTITRRNFAPSNTMNIYQNNIVQHTVFGC